jgi:hypothetical protein
MQQKDVKSVKHKEPKRKKQKDTAGGAAKSTIRGADTGYSFDNRGVNKGHS